MSNRTIAAALKAVEDRHGRLTASAVVDAARDEESPLHARFEWNDGVAAERWRLEQARELIRGVRVNVTVNRIAVPVVCYVRDPQAAETANQGYRSVTKLAPDSEDARDAVISEFARAASHLRRARDVATVLGFASEIEEMILDIVELDAKIKTGRGRKAVEHASTN